MKVCFGIAVLSCAAGMAWGQATVDYTTMGWSDFGTTDVTGVAGNFLPGWTTISATPDLGDDVFFVPTDSLSGVDNDAAMWFNQFDPSSPTAVSNEVARLSLSGFTIGQTYSLDFFATIVSYSFSGWTGNDDAIDVAIVGADISDWDSTILNDAVDADGFNEWVEQSLVFTATSSVVSFDFGSNASYHTDIGTQATRLGIDGFSARVVPAPSALGLLGLGGLAMGRRRR
tara:strand:- start:334211 stop:334897 length:687 start_codon:yes stop_codon:yes gene_type:complete